MGRGVSTVSDLEQARVLHIALMVPSSRWHGAGHNNDDDVASAARRVGQDGHAAAQAHAAPACEAGVPGA